jgi:hypothetical protein
MQARTVKRMVSVAWRCTALALLLGTRPNIAGAQTAPLPTSPIEQLRAAFARHGYDVDAAATGDWVIPPVTSFRVHDPQTQRVLLVSIRESTVDAADAFERAPGLRYDASTWLGEVTLFESDESSTDMTTLGCDPTALPVGTCSAKLPNAPNVDLDDQFVHILLGALDPREPEQTNEVDEISTRRNI